MSSERHVNTGQQSPITIQTSKPPVRGGTVRNSKVTPTPLTPRKRGKR